VLKRLAGRIGPQTTIEIGRPVPRPRRRAI